jgi:hypothetical protein
MRESDAQAFLKSLEDGKERRVLDGEGNPVAAAWLLSDEPILRPVRFESAYLPHRIVHTDARYPDPEELHRKWRAFVGEARAAHKQEIEDAGRRPMPSELAAKAATVVPAPKRQEPPPEEPEKPMLAHEMQRILREEREAAIRHQRLLREKQREADIRQGSDEGER